MPLPRKVSQVEWAHECEAPAFARKARLRGTKALGLAYERKLAKALPREAIHGQWFCYRGNSRVGFCQPDFLLKGSSELAVLEAKLTDVEAAREQLEQLYAPVLRACYGKRVLGIVVVKSLTRLTSDVEVCEDLLAAISCARRGRSLPVLHWIGTGRL